VVLLGASLTADRVGGVDEQDRHVDARGEVVQPGWRMDELQRGDEELECRAPTRPTAS
jgi:hypothetical protein